MVGGGGGGGGGGPYAEGGGERVIALEVEPGEVFVPSAVGSSEAMVTHGNAAVVEGFGDGGGDRGDRSRGENGRVRGDRGVKFGGEGLGTDAGLERGAVSAVGWCIWGGEEAGEEGVLVTGGGM